MENINNKIINPSFLALFGAVFLMFSAVDFYIPVMPFYVLNIGGGEAAVGMVMGLFTFFSVVLRPFQGRNLNRSGRKRLLVTGIALYVFAGLGLLFLPSLPLLYLLRSIQGLGWGAFLLAFNTLTLDLAPPGKSGEAVGIMGIAPPLSLATAPLFSEQLRISTSENYILLFLVTSLVALLALIIAVQVREPAMKKSDCYKPELFSKKVITPSLIIFCMTFNLGSIFTFLPLLGENRDLHVVGYSFTIFAVTTMISRPLAGKISDTLGRPKVFLPGLVVAASAMLLIAFSFSEKQLMLSAFILGIGFGAAHSSVLAMAADRLPVVERGVGMATFTTAFDLGIVAGSVVFGFLLAWFTFTHLFILCAFIMFAPVVGLFLLRRRSIFTL